MADTKDMSEKTGACLCGAIKYRLSGPSTIPHYSTICHCLNCRRWTGSALLTAAICPREGFEILQGEDVMKVYEDKFTDSGQALRRCFCSECGSNLFAFTPLSDKIVSVAAGSLDDSQDWVPDTEQYCMHRLPFVEKCKGIDPQRRHVESVRSESEKDKEDEKAMEETERGMMEGEKGEQGIME